MIKLLPPGLHAVLGDNAAGIFTRVFYARDRLLIDQDVLSCGPTPACADLTAWSKARADFWNELIPSHVGEHVHSRFNLIDNAQRLIDAERIHIWAATGLSEQLFIAFVVHLAQLVGANPSKLALVQFEVANKHRVTGLGELDEAAMREHPEPVAMSVEVAQHYLGAWAALTSPQPEPLIAFARTHAGANTWLKFAMRLMTRRFPDKSNGLPYWDHALLSRVKARGPEVSRIIGYTLAETFEFGDIVGDWYLFGRLMRMASARNPQPLVTLTGDQMSLRHTEAALTPFGERVLKGEASNYPANPIDDWAAGVRLSSEQGTVWFNDAGKLVEG